MAFAFGVTRGRKTPNLEVQYNIAKQIFDENTSEYRRRRALGIIPDKKIVVSIWRSGESMYNLGVQLKRWNQGWANHMIAQTKAQYPYG